MGAVITINNTGSLRVEGDFEIRDSTGARYDLGGRTAVSLCRCGKTQKAPFCDGSHRGAGFNLECRASTLDPPKTA
ncbi:MAG: CDGSH iron-sulfur domain-containing protein [Bacteroidota bacterium]